MPPWQPAHQNSELSPKPTRGGDAVGSAGGDGDRIGEQHRVGVEQQRQFVVVPQRIDLGQVGQVEAAALQAREVGHHLEPVQDRVHVEVRLVERAAVAVAFGSREARRLGRRDAGVEVEAAERRQAERLANHLDVARRLPEADRQADGRIDAAAADGLRRVASLSSWPPKLAIVAPPIVIGRMHDQQMSVIGFGNLPVQVAIGACAAAATRAQASAARRRRASDFIAPPARRCEGVRLPATRSRAPR